MKGKTYWVTYAACRRLGEGNPFIWYEDGVCSLFTKDGVFDLRVEDVSADKFEPFLWTFVDADEREFGVPETLAGHKTKLFIIFVTFPEQQHGSVWPSVQIMW